MQLEKDEQILSLDVKSLYTNIPVKEAINIALRSLDARDDKPDIPRTTMKRLLELAVTNVHFKCNEFWYCQKDRLAMGASLAVILANLWMKSWEPQLKLQTPNIKTNTHSSTCRNCEHRVLSTFEHVPGVLSVKFVIDGSTQNVSKSLTQNMIALKTNSGCAHSVVKITRLTLTIRLKLKFF